MNPRLFSRRRFLQLLAWTALAAAGGTRAATPDQPPLRIGLSLGLSGPYAKSSEMMGKAYRLWAEQVNSRGGLLGRPVELVLHDDRSDPAAARAIYEDLILRDKVDLILAPFSSAITAAVAPVAERHGYPLLAAGAAADEIWKHGYRFVFATIPPAGRQTIGLLAILADAGIDTLAIVESDDVYSAALAEGTRKWAAEYGIRIISARKVRQGTPDLEPMAREARQSGARALLMAGHFEDAVNMRRALKKIGWTPAAFYASVGPTLDAYRTALAGDEEGVLATSTWEAREDLRLPGSKEFLRAFVDRFRVSPSFIAAQAYSAGQLLEQALLKTGRLERKLLRDTLAAMDTNVIIGRYTVDQMGMLTKRVPLIIQWQRGRREIVWPPEIRTAQPRLGS